MMSLSLMMICAVLCSLVAASSFELDAQVRTLKQTLGKAYMSAKDGRVEELVAGIESMQAQLETWKSDGVASMQRSANGGASESGGAAAALAGAGVNGIPRAEHDAVAFEWSVTGVAPKGCDASRATEMGDKLRIHFVAKLHHPTEKKKRTVVDSSFHTGSAPRKIRLGDESNPPAWNDGLLGVSSGFGGYTPAHVIIIMRKVLMTR